MFQSSATGPIVVFKRMRVCMESYPIGHDSRSPYIRSPGPGISQGSATDTSMIGCPWRDRAEPRVGVRTSGRPRPDRNDALWQTVDVRQKLMDAKAAFRCSSGMACRRVKREAGEPLGAIPALPPRSEERRVGKERG